MKKVETRRQGGRRRGLSLGLLAGLALAGVAFAGCGGPSEQTAQGTQRAPGADARISADIDSNAVITRLVVDVDHLSPPERIEANGKHFVVWQRPSTATPWRRIGVLDHDADRRNGKLVETTVPHTRFELLITVEEQSNPQSPSSAVIIGPTAVG